VGRRAGLLEGLQDLTDPRLRARCESLLAEMVRAVGPDRIEEGVRQMMERFV
jgi:hypothetical protein